MLACGIVGCKGEVGLDYEGLQVLKRDENGRSGILGLSQWIRIRDLPKNSHGWKPDCDAKDSALMHRLNPKCK